MTVNSKVATVRPGSTLLEAMTAMTSPSTETFGLVLVTDAQGHFLGLLTDGDLLRLLAAGTDSSELVNRHMNKCAVTVDVSATESTILERALLPQRIGSTSRPRRLRHMPVLDADGRVVDVVDVLGLSLSVQSTAATVDVIGMGYVGLTLAVALASRGLHVVGIEQDSTLTERLNQGLAHIHEPQLDDLLRESLAAGRLRFSTVGAERASDVSILTVGTPVALDGSVDLSQLTMATTELASRLKPDSLVLLRSTIPMGTTRSHVLPLLEKGSDLRAGVDFHLAFTPERTVEGDAIRELSTLPQIVGGLTPACAQAAGRFWSVLANSLVTVDSLEAAELVKLANNSYRDHSFAFSNALALLADEFNIDAHRLIRAANESYPRDRIPLPSPGVGGYCLTKDPLIYASASPRRPHAELARRSRAVHWDSAEYVVGVVRQYATRQDLSLTGLRVLVAGLAFKGQPETNDLRGSASLQAARSLAAAGCDVLVFDAVINDEKVRTVGFEPVDLIEGASGSDAVLILNNHPHNVRDGLLTAVADRPRLIFDGWQQLDRETLERMAGITYATLGYMTPQG